MFRFSYSILLSAYIHRHRVLSFRIGGVWDWEDVGEVEDQHNATVRLDAFFPRRNAVSRLISISL